MVARARFALALAAVCGAATCESGEHCPAPALKDHALLQQKPSLSKLAPELPKTRKAWPKREWHPENNTALVEEHAQEEWWGSRRRATTRPAAPAGTCNIDVYQESGSCSYDDYNSRRRWSNRRREPSSRPAGAGQVDTLYTMGSPRLAACPLLDEMRPECCFDGLRVVTRAVGGQFDPVTVVGALVGYSHLQERSMTVSIPEQKADQPHFMHTETPFACGEDVDRSVDVNDACTPPSFSRCHDTPYWSWFLKPVYHGSEAFARKVLTLSAYAGKGPSHPINGWYYPAPPLDPFFRSVGVFVGQMSQSAFGTDGVMLYQDDDLNCYITFCQTQDDADWMSNLQAWSDDWCGAEQVHAGFASELRNILRHPDFDCEIKSKLPSCRTLTASGFSLGAALASLFSFCANRQMPGTADEDFQLVSWTAGQASRLPDYNSATCNST